MLQGSAGHQEGPIAVDTTSHAGPAELARPATPSRLRSVATIVIFDIAAPLATYSLLRSDGLSTVTALVLSGAFPALGVAIDFIRHRRLDVVGALVLAGIAVGTVLGLVSHSARLVLAEGSVPTGIFGVACLGSLRRPRPLMYSFALEFTGPETPEGREMIRLWQYDGYRRVLRVITLAWGAGFVLEAALRIVIAYNTPAGTALVISKITPWLWIAALSAWTVGYGAHQKKKGERQAAASLGQLSQPDHARSPQENT